MPIETIILEPRFLFSLHKTTSEPPFNNDQGFQVPVLTVSPNIATIFCPF